MFARLTKIVLSLPFLILAGLFGVYLIFGFFLVDPVAKKLLPWIGEKKLASQLTVQKVEFNPLTLEATVQGLKLAEKSGKPLAGFDRLYVNLETSGLFRFAWRIKDIQLSGPYANFEVRPGGKLNWAALIAKLNEDKEPPSKTLPRVLIDHIKIEQGDIEYTDANRSSAPFRASLLPLGIELDGLSTLPEDLGEYIIGAKLPQEGGTLKWAGDVSLNPVTSDGKIGLENINLPNLLRVIKMPRNVELTSGTLAAGTRYRFAMVKDKPWMQINGANLIVQNVALAPKGGLAPVFELKDARVDNANLDLTGQTVNVAAITLAGGRLAATRNLNGTLDWQTLFASPPAPGQQPGAPSVQSPAPPGAPWKLSVKEIKLDDWNASYADRSFAQRLSVEAARIGFTASLSGTIGTSPAIQIAPVNLSLGPVQVFSGISNKPVAQLDQARLSNASYDVATGALNIDSIDLSGARTSVVVGRDKQLNWNQILAKAPGAPTVKHESTPSEPKSTMKFGLGHLALNGMQLAFSDQSVSHPVVIDITNGHAMFQDLSLDLGKPVALEAGFTVKQGGSFRLGGKLVPGKLSGDVKLRLDGLSLKPFGPYVNQFARLTLNDGAASTSGRLKFAQGKQRPSLDYSGGFAVTNLAINEEDTGDDFLSWEKLASNSLEFKLGPNSLHMAELLAVKPFAKVIIFEDKSLNIKRIQRGYQPEPAAAPAAENQGQASNVTKPPPASQAAATVGPESAPEAGEQFPVDVERFEIDNAAAEYADLSLPTKFGTRMHSLSGVITGLSTDPATTAQVELDGGVDQYGSVRIRGSIQPFHATDFTDLLLQFDNLEMANLTPYSGKFAGRKIDSGRLSVKLEYKIKHRQLTGENSFVINKLRLGERVDSKDAMHLPLDLAIALLEDSNGVIDLDLPVTGSLDDPQFSYGRIIWKAIVNVLTKLITAPFRALGSLLGINSEKLEAIDFDFGSADLLPPEMEKLKNLAQAMAKRPALAITIEPGYEVKGDTRAIQELWMRRDVAVRMGLAVEPGKEPGLVDSFNPRTQKVLEALYDARFQKQGGLKAIKAEYEKPKEGAPSIYAEMLERLTLQIPVEEDELKQLAQQRGDAIKTALVDAAKIDPARVSAGAPVKKDNGGKMVVCKMTLGVSKIRAPAPSPVAPPSPGLAAPPALAPATVKP
ncbi:MAG: DUF748 domain-containing protein [Thiobacillaceae bacterium]